MTSGICGPKYRTDTVLLPHEIDSCMDRSSKICVVLLAIMFQSLDARALQIHTAGNTLQVQHTRYSSSEIPLEIDTDWMEHARLGTLLLPGCAAALVSTDGLAATSATCLRSQETWIRPDDSVFVADKPAQEQRMVGLAAKQLRDIRKFTDMKDRSKRVEAGILVELTAAEDSSSFTEYIWHIYDDIRLVMIPPVQIANFGRENGVYPRYALDIALFRVYDENAQTLETESYFAWSNRTPAIRERLFVTAFDGKEPFTHITLSDTFIYNGTLSPPYTTLYGMLDMHYSNGTAGDWYFPGDWNSRIQEAELSAALNFSVAGECIQKGAAIVDIDMEILGISFDHAHTGGGRRCVAVSTSSVLTLLKSVLDAESIAAELAEQALE